MSECISSTSNNKGAIQYTHLYLCISSGRRLTNFSMRSLFFQIHLHPSLCPLISHSVWCHRPDVHFNAAFYVELSKLEPLTINDLSISFDLYSRQLQSSSLLGIAKLPLIQKETLQKGKKPITYFYHQDPVDLIDPYTHTSVGNIFVTIALGYEEQLNLIEPQTRFIQVQLTQIDKKNAKYSSPSAWMKAAHKNGWMSIEEIEQNWMEIAQSNGWIPYQKNINLTLETFHQINILKEYEAPPTADLLTLEPETNSQSLFEEPKKTNHKIFPPTEIAEISPKPKPKTKFNNKIKKPVTVMDFFPRLSYSTKYDNNSEKSDSDWDLLIGKYLKTKSSTTLKSFPKQKRTKSAIYYNSNLSKDSFNNFQKDKNIEKSNSQLLDIIKSNSFFSQSESFELDSNNNFFNMENSKQNNNHNTIKRSNKKYNLDEIIFDEKEWSSDFFSDSIDTFSNQAEADCEVTKQENKKNQKNLFSLSLEEIVEKEMEKMSKNSKKLLQPQNSINKANSEISNKVIQFSETPLKTQSSFSENLNETSQKVESENSNKPVFFTPPPSLTQVIHKRDANQANSSQKVPPSKSSTNDQLSTQKDKSDFSDGSNRGVGAEDKGEKADIPYSHLDDQLKIHKRRRHSKNASQPSSGSNSGSLDAHEKSSFNVEPISKSETFSNTSEKFLIQKRKLRSPSPPQRITGRPSKRASESQDEESVENRFFNSIPLKPAAFEQFTSPTNSTPSGQKLLDEGPKNSSKSFAKNEISPHREEEEKIECLTSPQADYLNSHRHEAAPFSAPSHRRRHNEDDPIRPVRAHEGGDGPAESEKPKLAAFKRKRSNQGQIQISDKSQAKKRLAPPKADQRQAGDEPSPRSFNGDGEEIGLDVRGGTQAVQDYGCRQCATQSNEQLTSPKPQVSQENSRMAQFSAPHHRHHRRSQHREDGAFDPERSAKQQQQEQTPCVSRSDGRQEPSDRTSVSRSDERKEPSDRTSVSRSDERKEPSVRTSVSRSDGCVALGDDQRVASSYAKKRRQSNQQGRELRSVLHNGRRAVHDSRVCNDDDAEKPSFCLPQFSQTQQITVPYLTAKRETANSHHFTRLQHEDGREPSRGGSSEPLQMQRLGYEKVSHHLNRQQPSPDFADRAQAQKCAKNPKGSSPAHPSSAKISHKPFLPSPDITVFNGFGAPTDGKTAANFPPRSFVPTGRSMAESSPPRGSPKHRFIGADNSSPGESFDSGSGSGNKASPPAAQANCSQGLVKRGRRSSLARSNSPKPPPKEETFFTSTDDDDRRPDSQAMSKTIAVHSPTKKDTKAKLEGEISPQAIDFSLTSPTSSYSTGGQAGRRKTSANFSNQNMNRNGIKDSNEPVQSVKKTLHSKGKNSVEGQLIKGNGENSSADLASQKRKSAAAKRSPKKREKKMPKRPMDIKVNASFAAPGPLSPATPNAQKKGIRMSPSLERMINGIDKLEASFDISGIDSDSDS